MKPLTSFLFTVVAFIGCATTKVNSAELQTVPHVDLNRYLGTWYEVAKYPNSFQKGCSCAVANYRLDGDDIEVVNRCTKPDGSEKKVTGRAWIVDQSTRAKLKVSFLPGWIRWTGIGTGDYWIIDLDPDYKYAVVSEPSREYLWILARERKMETTVYNGILSRLTEKGFDVSKLEKSCPGNHGRP